MERKAAYSTLAEWFEYLNDDCDYENWSQYLIKKLAQFGNLTVGADSGLDVGCGGGYFTRALQRYGYEMTGMDVSAEMLDRAQSKAFKEGVRSEYILGDVSKGRIQKKYSFAVSVNDCFNYVEKSALKTALKNVYGCLKKGGVFVFDVSSPKKYREKFNDAVNVDDRDDVTYLSFAKTDGERAFWMLRYLPKILTVVILATTKRTSNISTRKRKLLRRCKRLVLRCYKWRDIWARRNPRPTAWYSLCENDEDDYGTERD